METTSPRAGRRPTRLLEPRDVTTVDGLPALSVEATIADLVEVVGDLSLVADTLRDTWMKSTLSHQRLGEMLGPVAHRGGHRKGDGFAMLNHLTELAGIDGKGLARRLADAHSFTSFAEVARQMLNFDSDRAGYPSSMAPTTHPIRGPLSGPTGRRVVEHRQELLDVLRCHGVTNPEIFGSAARGDDHEGSDLDLLVDLAPGTDLFDLVRIKRELEEVLGAPVDLIPRDGLKERVRAAAAKDLVSL